MPVGSCDQPGFVNVLPHIATVRGGIFSCPSYLLHGRGFVVVAPVIFRPLGASTSRHRNSGIASYFQNATKLIERLKRFATRCEKGFTRLTHPTHLNPLSLMQRHNSLIKIFQGYLSMSSSKLQPLVNSKGTISMRVDHVFSSQEEARLWQYVRTDRGIDFQHIPLKLIVPIFKDRLFDYWCIISPDCVG